MLKYNTYITIFLFIFLICNCKGENDIGKKFQEKIDSFKGDGDKLIEVAEQGEYFSIEECKYHLNSIKIEKEVQKLYREGKLGLIGEEDIPTHRKLISAFYITIFKSDPRWVIKHYYKTFYDIDTFDSQNKNMNSPNITWVPKKMYNNGVRHMDTVFSGVNAYWRNNYPDTFSQWMTLCYEHSGDFSDMKKGK
ncbi:hypothetical protein OAB00_03715 [Akkermansiaceae bacterium]|nr:hypothetical protein [Akkermansiaceae bacterium]